MKKFTMVSWEYYERYKGYTQVAHYFAKGFEDEARKMFENVDCNPYLDYAKMTEVELTDKEINAITSIDEYAWQYIHDENYIKRFAETFGNNKKI